MKNRFKIICLQTKSSKHPHKNIIMLEDLFNKLSTKVDLICLPECVAVFSDEKKHINLFLKKFKDQFFNLIKQQAIKKKCCIQIGSIPERYNQNKFVNRSYVIDEKGKIDSFYDKINLFDVKLNDYEYYYEYDCDWFYDYCYGADGGRQQAGTNPLGAARCDGQRCRGEGHGGREDPRHHGGGGARERNLLQLLR